MTEQDDFYDKLPYTLEENQIHPEYVIFGTGLQQTLIAAYRSKMEGKIGLIIDTEKTYGSSLKTLSFKEFNQLSSRKAKEKMYKFFTPEHYLEQNEKFYSESLASKKHRGYSIDIEPCFFLASSLTCECLKQADMDKYMDFHLVKSILHFQGSEIKHVPLSKGKIFQSNDLSLLQKKHLLSSLHKLMKIYQKYMNVELDMNSTKEFDKDMVAVDQSLYSEFVDNLENTFVPFLSKMVKKNKKIMNYLTYIICNYQYNYDREIPEHAKNSYTLKGFIHKFGKFIKSCGVYGEIPYLYVDNGIGDIPQAFSRIASIFASVYILHPKVQISKITKNNEHYEISTNLSPQKPIITKEIYYGPTHLELRKIEQQFYEQKILRVFILAEKCGKQESCPAICFITDLQSFTNPIFVFMFDNVSHSCPGNLIMYQFQAIVDNDDEKQCQEKAEKLVKVLQTAYGESFRQSIRYFSVYTRTRRYPKKSKHTNNDGIGLNDTMGIDLDPHFDNFIEIVGKQDNYFKKENPNDLQQEEYFGDDTKYILNRMDELNVKGELKSEEASVEVPKTEEISQKKADEAPIIQENAPVEPPAIETAEQIQQTINSPQIKEGNEIAQPANPSQPSS